MKGGRRKFAVFLRTSFPLLALALGVCRTAAACDTCSCGADRCTPHSHGDHSHADVGDDVEVSDIHSHAAGHGMRFTPVSLGSSTSQPTTAAGTSPPLRFGVVGDTQGLQFVSQLTADMNTQSLDLAIYPGDLVGTGGSASWDAWIARTNTANFDLYMVPGNHDLPVGGDALWQSKFHWLPDSQTVGGKTGIDKMDYFFDVGNTRFISVTTDSQAHGAGGQPAALDWFSEVLNDPSTHAKDHVFVYSHHPITFDQYDGTGGTYGDYWGAMVDSGAPVHGIFEGHWHQYQPGRPDPYNQQLWEVIVGTGNSGYSGFPWQNKIGFTVVEVNGSEATAEFYGDSDGDGRYDNVLDTFQIASATPRPTGLVAAYDFLDAGANLSSAPHASPVGLQIDGGYRNGAQAVGGVLQLDGVNDFADASAINDYELAILTDLTIAVRASFDSLDPGSDANTLVSYTSNVAGYTNIDEIINQPYNLRLRDDLRLEFMWEYANRQAMTFVSTLPVAALPGEWHDYAVTRDANAGEVRFFVNDVQLGNVLTFDPLAELPTGGQQGYLRLGANWITSESGFFDGSLAHVAIWNEVAASFDLPVAGDLNRDGDIDIHDFLDYLSGLAVDMSGLTPEERYEMGDLNSDGVNDFADFSIFKNAYEQVHGSGSFAAFLTRVPEPSTAALAVLGLLLPAAACRRARAEDVGCGAKKPNAIRCLHESNRLRTAGFCVGMFGVLLATAPSIGADLNTNLLINAGFESLGNQTEPQYGLSNILVWDGPGFAQGHSASGWANGAPLAGGGNYYYAGGGYTISQDVDLSSGDAAAAIGAGRGIFDLGAWFSGFSTQADFATLSVAFLDSGGAPLGSAISISTPDTSTWTQDSTSGDIPFQTASARVTISSQGGGWPDGYVDNALFQVVEGDAPLGLRVDQSTGDVVVQNPNDAGSIELDFYEIRSPSGSLLASWNSLEDQGLDAIGSGDGQHWAEGAGVGPQILTEVFLLGTSEVVAGAELLLDGTLNRLSSEQDLQFNYGLAADGQLRQGVVTYVGDPTPYDLGDFDADGDVDADDWNTLRTNQHVDLGGLSSLEAYMRGDMDGDIANNHVDFVLFKTAFDSINGPGSFVAMLAAVPEPGGLALALIACLGAISARRRSALQDGNVKCCYLL